MTPAQLKRAAESEFEKQGLVWGSNCYVQRLIDNCDLMNRGNRGHASLPRQPADYIVNFQRGFSHTARTFYAEIKGTELDKFSFSRFEPSQWAGMMRATRAGGDYFVFIWHQPSLRWVIMPARIILATSEEGSKSINLKHEVFYNDWTAYF